MDKAKSLILSTRYELNDQYLGKTDSELSAIGRSVQNGTFEFDEQEVKRVVEYARQVLTFTSRDYLDIAKWLLPPVVVVAAAVWFWLRA